MKANAMRKSESQHFRKLPLLAPPNRPPMALDAHNQEWRKRSRSAQQDTVAHHLTKKQFVTSPQRRAQCGPQPHLLRQWSKLTNQAPHDICSPTAARSWVDQCPASSAALSCGSCTDMKGIPGKAAANSSDTSRSVRSDARSMDSRRSANRGVSSPSACATDGSADFAAAKQALKTTDSPKDCAVAC